MQFTDEEIQKCVKDTAGLFYRSTKNTHLGREFLERGYTKDDLMQECYITIMAFQARYKKRRIQIKSTGLFYKACMEKMSNIYKNYRAMRFKCNVDKVRDFGTTTQLAESEWDRPTESNILYEMAEGVVEQEEWPYYLLLAGVINRNEVMRMAHISYNNQSKVRDRAQALATKLRKSLMP